MFKAISKWLEAKDQEAKQEQYDNGYGYAATRLMVYGDSPHDAEFDVTIFDRGIRDAVWDIANLQDKAKKLETIEKENNDLREIVRKMQAELKELLEQIPMQALSDSKLPFTPSCLPEWANWAAQDANGMWYCYEQEPIAYDSCFDTPKMGKYEYIMDGVSNTNWKDSLQRVTPEKSIDLPFKIEDLPEPGKWKWAAQDADGSWYVYENKPYVSEDAEAWAEDRPDGSIERMSKGDPNPNWKGTLLQLDLGRPPTPS